MTAADKQLPKIRKILPSKIIVASSIDKNKNEKLFLTNFTNFLPALAVKCWIAGEYQ